MHTRLTLVACLMVALLIGAALMVHGRQSTQGVVSSVPVTQETNAGTVYEQDGVQYVDITAHGGYTPRVTTARAGVPTIIRMKTENTFDCSSALVIPDISFQGYLKPTNIQEIPVPVEHTQGTLRGTCSMGMYGFQIDFE